MARRSARLAAGQAKPNAAPKLAPKPSSSANAEASTTRVRPPPRPIREGKKTFFDLPGEIRNQIYGELLPCMQSWDANQFVKPVPKGSASFMATCHQMYEEATSMLYAFAGSVELGMSFHSVGDVSFLEHSMKFEDTEPANFLILKRFKSLSLSIKSYAIEDSMDHCDMQDALFKALSNLRHDHTVVSLYVQIEVGPDEDDYYEVTPEPESYTWYGRRLSWNEKMLLEFRNIKPDDISRPHVTAFLTDPLQQIRGVRKTGSGFTLKFTGQTGRPWREIPGRVRDAVQSNRPVVEYDVFMPYFDTLRQLKRMYLFQKELKPSGFADRWRRDWAFRNGAEHEKTMKDRIDALAEARLRGDINTFRNAHSALIGALDAIVAIKSSFHLEESSVQAEAREVWCRELMYLAEELKIALPASTTDTSFFGYNVSNEGLRHWQTQGREEEKQAKAKRKREKEAKGKSMKKLKTSDGN